VNRAFRASAIGKMATGKPINLKVILPSGEVSVPVEPNSTPGHLKENLKYSIRLPPKFIKLTCEGRELVDIKTLAGEENQIVDGSVVYCCAKEGHEVEAAEAEKAEIAERAKQAAAEPTMIRKEEDGAKKKKIREKKDVERPTVGDGDVVKKEKLSPGYQPWKPQYIDGKHKKRHLAFLKVEAVDEKKTYPEQDNDAMALALGDPHTSPVWTAAVTQMEIGEKATFAMSRKTVDFDPEGLNPVDSSATWTIELVRMIEVIDVNEDFAVLLHVDTVGTKDRAEDLDKVQVHWRVRKWEAEGNYCIGSSRERIAIMPGYGLVPIEDMNAPPVAVAVGEGQQEAVELVANHCGVGGKGHVYLKSESMKGNRPQGCVIFDVELVGIEQVRGPGTPGWGGWTQIINERETGDNWLEEADGRRKQLETFGMMRKSTSDSVQAEEHVASLVHKFANNAVRRYRRALKWSDAEENQDKKIKNEKSTLGMRLAKASALGNMRFGENPGDATDTEKKALKEALELLATVLTNAEEMKNDNLVFECLKLNLQVCIQAEDVPEAKKVLAKLQELRPGDDELKSDSARLNRMEQAVAIKKGGGTVETLQQDLRAANEAKDKPKIEEALAGILDLMKTDQVKFETITKLKVGKDVGNAMKLGEGFADVTASARKVVGEIQALAQRNAMMG